MTQEEKLLILKKDLQMTTKANDDLLEVLLKLADEEIKGEGIHLIKDDTRSDMAVVQYAAYLFRKRGAPETAMPRYLRWQLNNMKFSRKYGGTKSDV